jgi:hypothetical protein
MRQVPAYRIRLDTLEMTFRLKGSYAPPASQNGTKKCVQVIVAPPPPKSLRSDTAR